MLRIRIITEFKEYRFPSWAHLALIKSDRVCKVIEIHTILWLTFTIAPRKSQNLLYALLHSNE